MKFIAELKKTIHNLLPPGSDAKWIVSGLRYHPISFSLMLIRSLVATRKLTGKFAPIAVRFSSSQKLVINKSKSSTVEIKGIITIKSWGGLNSGSSISISNGAAFQTFGDLTIGPGVHISVEPNGILKFGGKRNSSESGITCNARIGVSEYVEIGSDSIIAWDVFITDSDWHDVQGSRKAMPVCIGNHVWISHGVSILKGSIVPDGCIVGAKALIGNKFVDKNCLIAGIPAKVCKRDIQWSR
jgi:acetyltransferase-like isoleucine patch superfamily enzyme